VIHPTLGAPQTEIILPGNIQAFTDSPIYARTNGYLKKWYVDIGGRVKQGQLLAEIETPEVDQQLDQARADLNTAQANYSLSEITAKRYEDLLKTDSVSKQDVDNAEGDFAAKKAMVASAQSNLKRLEELQSFEKIYAPFDGVITARNTDVGHLINSGAGGPAAELFHIAAIRTLRVYINVPQQYSQAAKPGISRSALSRKAGPHGRRNRSGHANAARRSGCGQRQRRASARRLHRGAPRRAPRRTRFDSARERVDFPGGLAPGRNGSGQLERQKCQSRSRYGHAWPRPRQHSRNRIRPQARRFGDHGSPRFAHLRRNGPRGGGKREHASYERRGSCDRVIGPAQI
jgi:multidrug efflux pump subunit AcrA (membrane-fusion protein)